MATITAFPLPDTAQKSAEATQALHDDIRTRWSRLTDIEIGHLKDNDDLVTKIAGLYGLERATAQSDVNDLLKGRTI
jgi:hypothetical protein